MKRRLIDEVIDKYLIFISEFLHLKWSKKVKT